MTDNYIDARHEYFTGPDDNGMRFRSVDVWYATRPNLPEYGFVDYDDNVIEGTEANVRTAWTIHKAGQDPFLIFDRDDIAGLRKLLDKLEVDMDRRDMEELTAEFNSEGVDKAEDSE